MSENQNEMKDVTRAEPAPQLKPWQRWLEFVQVIAALSVAAGLALPWGLDLRRPWAWAVGLIALGFGAAWASLRWIRIEEPPDTPNEFEITDTRLLTLEALGTPKDIVSAMRAMHGPSGWTGSGRAFRGDFYARLGAKRGASYLPTVLPYLAVYREVTRVEKEGVATTVVPQAVDGRMPISEQVLR
jgi:hypothetical protein